MVPRGNSLTILQTGITTGRYIFYSYFMPVCIVNIITPRCHGRADAIVHQVVYGTKG